MDRQVVRQAVQEWLIYRRTHDYQEMLQRVKEHRERIAALEADIETYTKVGERPPRDRVVALMKARGTQVDDHVTPGLRMDLSDDTQHPRYRQ
jgi:hypothetical protein